MRHWFSFLYFVRAHSVKSAMSQFWVCHWFRFLYFVEIHHEKPTVSFSFGYATGSGSCIWFSFLSVLCIRLGTPLVQVLVFCWSTQGEIGLVSGPKLHNKLNHKTRKRQFTTRRTWQVVSAQPGLSGQRGSPLPPSPALWSSTPRVMCSITGGMK